MNAAQWNRVKQKVLTLDEVWDILNKYDVAYSEAAQKAMELTAHEPVKCKPCVFCRIKQAFRKFAKGGIIDGR